MTAAPCIHVDRHEARVPLGRLWLVFVLTFVFMLVETVGGLLAGSLALLADAGHMLTDVGALGLTLATAWIARRPADQTKTYGYLRWEILAALINGALLFVVAGLIVKEAWDRLQAPPAVQGGLMLAVAGAGLVVNVIALALLHRQHNHQLNVRGAYLHILGDLLGSVGAVAAAAVILLTGWTLADPLISILLSLFILVGAWRLVRESVDILLEAVPRHISLEEVEGRIRAVDGVSAVHDLHVWTVTSGMVAMSGHAVVPDLEAHPRVLELIRRAVADLGVGHVTIQLETGRDGDCETPPARGVGSHPHRH